MFGTWKRTITSSSQQHKGEMKGEKKEKKSKREEWASSLDDTVSACTSMIAVLRNIACDDKQDAQSLVVSEDKGRNTAEEKWNKLLLRNLRISRNSASAQAFSNSATAA